MAGSAFSPVAQRTAHRSSDRERENTVLASTRIHQARDPDFFSLFKKKKSNFEIKIRESRCGICEMAFPGSSAIRSTQAVEMETKWDSKERQLDGGVLHVLSDWK